MIKLNLGGGQHWKQEGWINLDLHLGYDISANYLAMFANNVVDNIYTSHFLEHLEYRVIFELLKDCYRVLKPQGLIRIVVPSVDRLLDIIENDDKDLITKYSQYWRLRPQVNLNEIV